MPMFSRWLGEFSHLRFAEVIVTEFLETPFEGDRHSRRVAKIKNLEGDSSP